MSNNTQFLCATCTTCITCRTLHIVKEECRHIRANNEASLKSMQSSIQPDGQFVHPVIRLFTATLNPSRRPDGPSFFLGGFVFVGAAAVPQTQHTKQPLIPPVIRPDCFFLGGFVFVAAAVVGQTQHRDIDFLGGFVFVAFGEPTVGVSF